MYTPTTIIKHVKFKPYHDFLGAKFSRQRLKIRVQRTNLNCLLCLLFLRKLRYETDLAQNMTWKIKFDDLQIYSEIEKKEFQSEDSKTNFLMPVKPVR